MNTKKLLLIFIPALIIVGLGLFIEVLRYEPLFPKTKNQTDAFVIPVTPDDLMLGVKRAPKTIVAFEDFSCPSCRQNTEILDGLIAKHPGIVKVIWKSLPVTQFPYPSEPVVRYAVCANVQGKFADFKTLAFANTDHLSDATLKTISETLKLNATDLDKCLTDTKTENYLTSIKTLATLLNIQSVPTFFVDNKQIEAPGSIEGWETLLSLPSQK